MMGCESARRRTEGGQAVRGPGGTRAARRSAAGPPAEGAIALVLVPILVIAFAYAAPFLGGFQSILGLAIIGFGVYEAWKINRRETHAISGPFAVAAPSGAVPESAGPPALG